MCPGVMHARFADARGFEQRMPVAPEVVRVDGIAGRRAEDQVQVFPGGPRGEAPDVLASPVGPQLDDERGWNGQDQLGLSLSGLDARKSPLRHGMAVQAFHRELSRRRWAGFKRPAYRIVFDIPKADRTGNGKFLAVVDKQMLIIASSDTPFK